jgi:acetoacetate decarboxylase
MDRNTLLETAFTMPLDSPAYPKGPYFFKDLEFFVVIYETDPEKLRQLIPEPLELMSPVVKFEFVRMPNSTGFGEYIEVNQVIPVTYEWEEGSYIHAMYTNVIPPIIGGREIWGFPKKLGEPTFNLHKNILTGTLDYGGVRVATATMGYKYKTLSSEACLKTLELPNFLLKIIPHVNGSPRICELVRYYLQDIHIKEVWTGPCSLELHPHALAPVADFPVYKVLSGLHILADFVLPYGEVVCNYLQE